MGGGGKVAELLRVPIVLGEAVVSESESEQCGGLWLSNECADLVVKVKEVADLLSMSVRLLG